MTREELIEQEAEKLYPTRDMDDEIHSDGVRNLFGRVEYKAFAKSQLAKDLQELAVIEGKIEVLMWVHFRVSFANILKSDIYRDIEQLSSTRTELLKRLNLEG
jgi:hypothetical protein